MSNRVGLRRLLAAVLFVVCVCAVVGTALAAGPGRGAGEQKRLAELLKREGAVAQLVRGPGGVSGRELVVGANWLSVDGPSSEGETVEFWAHPRRGVRDRDRRITLGWGASSLRFRRALAPEKWSHVSVSWDEARVRLDLDGQTIESYGLGEPSGVAEPHRLSVGRDALTSAPRWVALYNSSIDVRSVVRHYRAALPLMRPVADPPANRDGRVIAHAAAVPANTVLPTITGTAKDGQTLTSTTGTWTGSPTSYARQWLRCDTAGASCTNISGATSTTYVLTATDVGKTIRVKVTATNGSGSANVNSAQTATVVAAAPVVSAVPTTSGTAKDGQTLTSTTGTWSGTPTITYARQWNRCNSGGTGCVAISGATGTTYVVTTADIGSKLNVTVTASNAAGSASSSSVVTALVVGAAPANTALPVVSGTAKEGQLLSVTTGTWTGSTPITYTYQWQQCTPTCANISGATASTYRLVAAQVGKTIKAVVTATNGTGSASATSAATATVTTGAPVNTALPVVTGTTTDGQTLSSTTGTWAGTATITYAGQWKRCDGTGANCTNISGATGTTYTLTSADVTKTIKLTVTATNGVGNTAADAATTAVIAGIAPANTALPTVTGTTTDGQTLTAGNGTWTGSTPIAYSYQWNRCDSAGANCTTISGATASTYTLVSADVGARIRARVTATNSTAAVAADSNATTTVIATAPANTAVPVVTGDVHVGQQLSSTTGSWTGTATITYARKWQRCDLAGANCADIPGATATTYTLTDLDIGTKTKVAVTATNGAGSVTANSSATAVIVGVAPSNSAIPTITGTVQVGRALSATHGSWTGAPTPNYDYQWQRCNALGSSCIAISGATASTYTQAAADLGLTLRVQVTATNIAGQANATTAATAVVSPATLSNTTAPVVTGDARSGHELSASAGEWSSTTPVTTTYQWQQCDTLPASCTDLTGADEETLDLDDDHIGHRYRVVVTASNGLLSDSEPSALTSVVTAASADEPTITLSGTLVANPTSWLTASSYQLTVLAGAGTDSEGLQSVMVELDDEQIGRWDEGCTPAACTVSHTLTVSTAELTEGEHDLDVVAYDTDGHTTKTSATLLVDHGLPQAPSGVVVMDDLATNVVSWTRSASADVAEYEVLRRTSPTGSLTSLGTTLDNTFTDVLPPASGAIEYVVRTHDSAGNLSTDSNAATITIGSAAATAPTGLVVSLNDDGALQLDWNTTATATGYIVYEQAPDETVFSPVANVAAPATTFIEDSAGATGQYDFRLRAIMPGSRLSASTSTVSYDLLDGEDIAAPDIELSGDMAEAGDTYLSGTVGLDIDATEGTTEEPAPGVEKIEVYVDEALAQTWSASCATNSCAMQRTWNLDTTQLDDGGHEVRVVATDVDDHPAEARLSIRVDNAVPAAPPHAWISKTTEKVTVHWSPSSAPDLAGYVVLDGDDNVWAQPAVDDDSVEFDAGNCDVDCTFQVAAIDDAGRQSTTAEAYFAVSSVPAVPVLSATAQPGTVSLSWTTISGVSYVVLRSTPGNGTYEQITSTPVVGTTFADGDVDPGVTYYYVVRAVTSGGGASVPSNEISVTPGHYSTAPAITLGGSLAAHQGQVLATGSYQLTANAAETGVGIELLEVTIDGITVSRQDTPCPPNNCTLNATVDFATADYTDGPHLVQVTATDRHRETTTSAITVTTDDGAPNAIDGLAASALDADSVRLSWTAPHETDIATYKVYRGTDPGSLTLLTTTAAPATTFDDNSAPTSQKLWYALQAVDTNSLTSPISDPVSATTGGTTTLPLTGLHAQSGPYSITLDWNAITATDLGGYRVYRKTGDETDYQPLTPSPIPGNQYIDATLSPGSTATYVVRAIDTNGQQGPESDPVEAVAHGMGSQDGTSPLVLHAAPWSDATERLSNELWVGTDRLGDATYTQTPCADPPGFSGACAPQYQFPGTKISPDGRSAMYQARLYDPVDRQEIVQRDLATGQQTLLCPGPHDPEGHDLPCAGQLYGPDGSSRYAATWAWTGSEQGPYSSIWERSVPDGVPHQFADLTAISPKFDPSVMVAAADGSMLVTGWDFETNYGQCLAAKLDPSGQVTQLITHIPYDWTHCNDINLTTDGERLIDFEESYGYPRVVTTALDGTDLRYVTPPGVAATWCCEPSPDGQRVLFVGRRVEVDAQGHIDGSTVPYMGNSFFWDQALVGTFPRQDSLFTADIDTGELRSQAIDLSHPLSLGAIGTDAGANYPQASSALRLTADSPSTNAYRSGQAVTLGATAQGIRSTVSEMALFFAGQRYEPVGTPSNANFRIPLSGVSEGRHAAHIAAATSSGLEKAVNRTVIVDNTAPKVTDQLDGAEGDTEDSTIVSWEPSKDPALADGTAGSGVQRTQYRYKKSSGGWTGWATATDSKFSAPADELTETVDLRTEDAAGNRRLIRARMSQMTREVVSGKCGLSTRVSSTGVTKAYYPQFKIAETRPRFVGAVRCHSDVTQLLVTNMCVSVMLRGNAWTPTQSCFSRKRAVSSNTDSFGPIGWTCQRPADGATYFRMAGNFQVFTNILNRTKKVTSSKVKYLCPTESSRVEAEAIGWRALRLQGTSKPSETLGDALGRAYPFEKKRGWQAHHVIPANEKSAEASFVQSIGFRCHVDVNSRNNGIWLRGRFGGIANDTAGYDALASITSPPNLQDRVQHWNYGYRYSAAIAPTLMTALDGDGSCRGKSALAKRLYGQAAIRRINAESLAAGYIPGIGASPPN